MTRVLRFPGFVHSRFPDEIDEMKAPYPLSPSFPLERKKGIPQRKNERSSDEHLRETSFFSRFMSGESVFLRTTDFSILYYLLFMFIDNIYNKEENHSNVKTLEKSIR